MKTLIFDDLYKPHDIDELRDAGVDETVIGSLDEERRFGLYWYQGVPRTYTKHRDSLRNRLRGA